MPRVKVLLELDVSDETYHDMQERIATSTYSVEDAIALARECAPANASLLDAGTKARLFGWCEDYLRLAGERELIDPDTPNPVIRREARRLAPEILQLAASFIDNTYSGSGVEP